MKATTGNPEILQLGNPGLRVRSHEVARPDDPAFHDELARLQDALAAFQREHGFGRAMAAPQLGMARRVIAINLGKGPFAIINPEVTWRSDETFTLWDDCMSFPWLMVRVRRHRSLSLRYVDEQGQEYHWERLEPAESELLQHEIDHLDGILAVDRAEGGSDALISRAVYLDMTEHFARQVDGI